LLLEEHDGLGDLAKTGFIEGESTS
jgi:hypothetical protein